MYACDANWIELALAWPYISGFSEYKTDTRI
jgi:hypothetical protein